MQHFFGYSHLPLPKVWRICCIIFGEKITVVEELAFELSHTSREAHASVRAQRSEHFWICSSPFFETSLILSPTSADPEFSGEETVCECIIHDCDGSVVNEVILKFSAAQIRIIELASIMTGCKMQAGLRHGHLEVKYPLGIKPWCRLQSRDSACLLGSPQCLTDVRRVCLPLTFSAERTNLVCLVNYTDSEATVRGKLFLGRRAPEAAWKIPAFGSRVLEMIGEFDDFVDIHADEQVQGYLRLSGRGSDRVGVHAIEQSIGMKDTLLFASLT